MHPSTTRWPQGIRPCLYLHSWVSWDFCFKTAEAWELDTTEWLRFDFSLSCIGEGNGNPLQYSCLEDPRDRGAWWAAVYGVAWSQTQLKQLSSSSKQKRPQERIQARLLNFLKKLMKTTDQSPGKCPSMYTQYCRTTSKQPWTPLPPPLLPNTTMEPVKFLTTQPRRPCPDRGHLPCCLADKWVPLPPLPEIKPHAYVHRWNLGKLLHYGNWKESHQCLAYLKGGV